MYDVFASMINIKKCLLKKRACVGSVLKSNDVLIDNTFSNSSVCNVFFVVILHNSHFADVLFLI